MGKRTKAEDTIIKALSKEEQEAFAKLPEDRQVEMLAVLAVTSVPVDTGFAFEDVGTDEEENVTILAAGGIGCGPGTVIVGRFLGTMPMFSKDHKENWDKHTVDGNVFYANAYYLFEDVKTAKRFGIYKSPCLNKVLPKLPTRASNQNVAADPVVRIEYIGKIEGKDKLKDKYDLVISSGNNAHVHIVQLQKGLKFDKYRSGCLNYLRNPIPNLGEKESLDALQQAEKDWAQTDMLNTPAMDGRSQAQLA